MWRLTLAGLRYRAGIFALAWASGIACALGLLPQGEGPAVVEASLLLLIFFVIWSVVFGYEQGEQRHFLHLALPLSRRQVAGGRVLSIASIQMLSYGAAALFLALGNRSRGVAWSEGQTELGLINPLLLALGLSGLLLEEATARALAVRWRLLAVVAIYFALVFFVSIAFFLGGFVEGSAEGELGTGALIRFGLERTALAVAALYLLAATMASSAVELFRRRPNLDFRASCWQGIEAIWKGNY